MLSSHLVIEVAGILGGTLDKIPLSSRPVISE
jgi:hypothetical protein